MGERTGTVIVEIRIFRNAGRVYGILPFYVPFKVPKGIIKWHFEFVKLCLIGQNVLLNSDVDGNNMNKSDAIDIENNFKYTNDK